jgi:hypothetical protein
MKNRKKNHLFYKTLGQPMNLPHNYFRLLNYGKKETMEQEKFFR